MTDENDEEKTVHEIKPSDIANVVLYQQLIFQQLPNGEVQTGITQVPVPKNIIESFQDRFGAEMEQENLKLVIVKGKAFLAPAKQSSLIGFN